MYLVAELENSSLLVLKLIKICGFKKLLKFVNIRTVNIHLLTTQKPQWNGNSELCVADSDDSGMGTVSCVWPTPTTMKIRLSIVSERLLT